MKPKWLKPVAMIFDLLGEPAVIVILVVAALWVVFGA